jgi:hypothetical protein
MRPYEECGPSVYRGRARAHRAQRQSTRPSQQIDRWLSARARNRALIRRRNPRQLGQRTRSGLMHGRAHQHLDCFQIEVARLADAREDGARQLLYFARDFLLDRLGRFFSCSALRTEAGVGKASPMVLPRTL